ncbi:MAG: PrpF domain-containing protein [Paracoccaceae bacterium]
MQTGIPYIFIRGGTSRGPYFRRADLPEYLETLADVLTAVVGSGHPLNIDGIGGGNAVRTKVAILSVSDDDWAGVMHSYKTFLVSAQTNLEQARKVLAQEISDYPTPIAGCDAQFNHLLAKRSKIQNALHEISAEVFIPTPRTPDNGDRIESR